MSTLTSAGAADINSRDYWLARRDHLFLASRMALIVTAMSFAIRGDIKEQLGTIFHLSKTQLGSIDSCAFLGFTVAMIFGGPLCDVVGMGRIMVAAFIFHALGIGITILSHDYQTFFIGALCIGIGNGAVEAACNPLVATLYPDQKIKRLNGFHVWFPGGIVIGGLASYAISTLGKEGLGDHLWQVQMATMIVPLIIYGFMFFGRQLPRTERVSAGVSTGDMFKECVRPAFLLFVVLMLLTAVTELGTEQWIPNIMTLTTGVAGILYLCWINGLMAVGRTFAGEVVHHLSPVQMLMGSALFSIIGVYGLAVATNAPVAYIAATLFAVGVCFFWPTMLGVVSERFPRTGALGLAVMGGAGNLSIAYISPQIGSIYDSKTATAAQALGKTVGALEKAGGRTWDEVQAIGGAAALKFIVVIPIVLLVVFTCIYFYDRSRGGYRVERIGDLIEEDAGEAGASATLVQRPTH